MLKLLGTRIVALVPILLMISIVSVALTTLIPGDAAEGIAGASATPEQIAQVRAEMGLDQGLVTQYWNWLTDAARGDFGRSLIDKSQIAPVVLDRLSVTLSLALVAALIGLVLGVTAGTLAALRAGSLADRVITLLSSVALAMPAFWLGLILVTVFALKLGWFPATGYVPITDSPGEWLRSIILPGFALGLVVTAMLARHARASMIQVLQMPHIRTARAMGLPAHRVLGKHALKSSLSPVVTTMGFQFAYLLGGAVVIEQVFGIPGMGDLVLTAVNLRDIPVIQAVVVTTGVCVALAQLLVDISYGYLNPKVRLA
ncbi:ABC transporter permease [Tomitella biformata]|uniref:ABC transporter permease n=1 Tax=Tomitella biformata TaxID=630403 RepID=UPI000464D2C7|nr:ABC transporter permease [Tomitella biformata]